MNSEELVGEYLIEEAKNDLALFHLIYREKELPPHQERWLDILNKGDFKYFLKLAPRDHGKTEVFAISYPLYRIVRDRNIRILNISKSSGQAIKTGEVIRRELEYNLRLKRGYGEFKGNRWTDKLFSISERDYAIKDPTFESVGVEGAITGGHFDLIIADDIVDDENVRTEKRREDIFNWFHGTILQLAEPWTQVVVVGTRKHFDDLYNRLIENPLWICDPESAIQKWPDKYEYIKNKNGKVVDVKVYGDSEVLWIEKWDIKTLLLDRLATGSLLFDREKQNDPSSMKGNFLKLQWLNWVDENEIPSRQFLTIYFGIDLAISKDTEADYTAIAIIGIDSKNRFWLLDIYRARLDFPEAIKTIENLAKIWEPKVINIESNAYQAAINQQLMLTTTLPIRESNTTKDKITRIATMAANFENGRVQIKKGLDVFEREWLEFPNGKHDDTLDATEKALEVAVGHFEMPTGKNISEQELITSNQDW